MDPKNVKARRLEDQVLRFRSRQINLLKENEEIRTRYKKLKTRYMRDTKRLANGRDLFSHREPQDLDGRKKRRDDASSSRIGPKLPSNRGEGSLSATKQNLQLLVQALKTDTADDSIQDEQNRAPIVAAAATADSETTSLSLTTLEGKHNQGSKGGGNKSFRPGRAKEIIMTKEIQTEKRYSDLNTQIIHDKGIVQLKEIESLKSEKERNVKEIEMLWEQLREKKAKISLLQSHFQQLRVSVRAEKQIQIQAVQQCKRQRDQLLLAKEKLLKYSRDIKNYEMQSHHVTALEAMLGDTRAEKEELARRLESLHTSALRGDRLEEKRIQDMITKHQAKEVKAKRMLDETIEELQKTRRECRALKIQVEDEKEAKEKYRLVHLNTQDLLLSAKQQLGGLKERIAILEGHGTFGTNAVDVKDLQAALEIVRRRRDNPSSVYGIDTGSTAAADPRMQKELHGLEARYQELSLELKSKRKLLVIQQRTIDDQKSEVASKDAEIERLKVLLAEAKKSSLLVPFNEDNASVASSMFSITSALVKNRRRAEQNIGIEAPSLPSPIVSAPVSANVIENIISVRIMRATIQNTKGFGDDLLTCITTDFMTFAPEHSHLVGGKTPEYNLTVQYRVKTDAVLINALQTAEIMVELLVQADDDDQDSRYYSDDDDYETDDGKQTNMATLGIAKIPAKGLLMNPTGSLSGSCQIVASSAHVLAKDGDDGGGRRREAQDVIGILDYHIASLWPLPGLSPPTEKQQLVFANGDSDKKHLDKKRHLPANSSRKRRDDRSKNSNSVRSLTESNSFVPKRALIEIDLHRNYSIDENEEVSSQGFDPDTIASISASCPALLPSRINQQEREENGKWSFELLNEDRKSAYFYDYDGNDDDDKDPANNPPPIGTSISSSSSSLFLTLTLHAIEDNQPSIVGVIRMPLTFLTRKGVGDSGEEDLFNLPVVINQDLITEGSSGSRKSDVLGSSRIKVKWSIFAAKTSY
eukprot:jgi/Bigna1/144837/aug1.92_g19545